MGKIAFVFSGQGDQHPGMGRDLAQQYAAAADVFAVCDAIRPGTSAQCFFGTEEELTQTENTQPCLFAMEMAAAAVLDEMGIEPAAAAGFSLGEVAACTAAGVFDLETGFRLVCRRGELMQQAAQMHDTSMAAVVKLQAEQVEEICGRYSGIYPVNYNCPGQVSVAGLSRQMPEFYADVKAAGGRAIPLKVRGAFHSPFMREASDAFAEELTVAECAKSRIALYSNATAQLYEGDARQLLARQIASPVLWQKTICNMIASGIDTFIEIGPGKTLTNMIGKIDPQARCYYMADLPKILAEVRGC